MLNPECLRRKENFKLIDSAGNILMKFRLISTARRWKNYIKKNYPDELNIEKI
ncbi:MAG: hypothetical protein WC758_07870 [Candidatus Woesearchaeota archaeon]